MLIARRRGDRMKRREFITLLGGATVAWPLAARAQQGATVARIGYLSPGTDMSSSGSFSSSYMKYRRQPLLEGLRELGWVEGQNITIENRFAGGRTDQLPALAADLVRLKVDVIVTAATPAAKAAQNATSTIPIVIADPGDPVQLGLVASLARPGANITGVISIAPDLATKRLALLKEALPTASRVAVLWNAVIPPAEVALKELQVAASDLGIGLQLMEVTSPGELNEALGALARGRIDGLLVFPDPLTFNNSELIARTANKNVMPAMFGAREFVEAGGLMSYGPSYPLMFRRAGSYVGRILKGTKPADLPVEQPTRFELVINLKTAKVLGLEVPPTLLARADEVIE
jgi:putative tryptophan/tyrosine transport system substrate-binding protein